MSFNKSLIYVSAVISVMASLLGCDQSPSVQSSVSQPKTEKKYEEFKFECSSNSGKTNCTVVAGDLLGSGKWHHAKIYMAEGNVDANIDGEHYSKIDFSSDFYEGIKYNVFKLESTSGNTANVTITQDQTTTGISFEAHNQQGEKFLTAAMR